MAFARCNDTQGGCIICPWDDTLEMPCRSLRLHPREITFWTNPPPPPQLQKNPIRKATELPRIAQLSVIFAQSQGESLSLILADMGLSFQAKIRTVISYFFFSSVDSAFQCCLFSGENFFDKNCERCSCFWASSRQLEEENADIGNAFKMNLKYEIRIEAYNIWSQRNGIRFIANFTFDTSDYRIGNILPSGGDLCCGWASWCRLRC